MSHTEIFDTIGEIRKLQDRVSELERINEMLERYVDRIEALADEIEDRLDRI